MPRTSSARAQRPAAPTPPARVTSRLSRSEVSALRRAALRKEQLGSLSPRMLAKLTGIPLRRCVELSALSRFQALDSVGPATAEDLWILGYRSVAELRTARPRKMYEKLCRLSGVRLDPCVEDVFRAAVAQARDPDLPSEQRNWWYWTPFREEGTGAAR
jgi:hypothetical protein